MTDSIRNKLSGKSWSTSRSKSWWRCETNRRRSSTSKLQKLRPKLMNHSQRRNENDFKCMHPSRLAALLKSKDWGETRRKRKNRRWSSWSSSNWGIKNYSRLRLRRMKSKDRDRWNSPISNWGRSRIKILGLRKNSKLITWPQGDARHCSTNRRRAFTHMLRNALQSGSPTVRT